MTAQSSNGSLVLGDGTKIPCVTAWNAGIVSTEVGSNMFHTNRMAGSLAFHLSDENKILQTQLGGRVLLQIYPFGEEDGKRYIEGYVSFGSVDLSGSVDVALSYAGDWSGGPFVEREISA